MAGDPSPVSFIAGPMTALLHGQRKDATDILSFSELTIARCQTLLYLPLLNACFNNSRSQILKLA